MMIGHDAETSGAPSCKLCWRTGGPGLADGEDANEEKRRGRREGERGRGRAAGWKGKGER